MAKQQVTSFKKVTLALFVSVTLLILASIIFVTLSLAQKNDDQFAKSSLALTEQKYTIEKLTFCINNDIKPCNDEALSSWNTDNQGNTFELKTFQQLVEASIQTR